MILKILILLGIFILYILFILAVSSLIFFPREWDIKGYYKSMLTWPSQFKEATIGWKIICMLCVILFITVVSMSSFQWYTYLLDKGYLSWIF